MLPGVGSAAGNSSPAYPTSSPAEIMEQRLSNRHPRLAVPGPVQLQSPHRVPAARGAAGLGRMVWEKGTWIGAGGRSLAPPGEREWKPKEVLQSQWLRPGWWSKEGFLLKWDSGGSWWCF